MLLVGACDRIRQDNTSSHIYVSSRSIYIWSTSPKGNSMRTFELIANKVSEESFRVGIS